MDSQTKVMGVILAGGQSRRMDYQDKGLQIFRGQSLISYSFNALRPVVSELIINANQNLDTYQKFGVPVISDLTQNFSGALAGILAAMNYTNADLLLIIPCDAPFITSAQLQHLLAEHKSGGADITVARTGEQIHSVFLVVKTSLQASLETYLAADNHKVQLWLEQHHTNYVDFGADVKGFENINTLNELNAIL
ncbi:MAG: molybdenum cofactor guanylyltransferase [Methylococcales bacterium]|nr:molybdenum cofactor guanylyltransferase [Methylococcales bacterium]MDD5754090.1 molybdenum cofactor guanylyltransferase [Methylococcales bacterium]